MHNVIVVKKADISISDAERKLNGNYPVVAISPRTSTSFLSVMNWPYLYKRSLPSDAKYNPDKYILPLDIVKRPINNEFDHYAIYLGNRQVAHFPGGGKPTQFDSWKEFHSPSSHGSSSSLYRVFDFINPLNLNNSNSPRSDDEIVLYHPQIPFKRKEEIIRHIAKAISCGYGRNSYDIKINNCEHIVKRCILGIDFSPQAASYSGIVITPMDIFRLVRTIDSITDKSALEERITLESNKLDDLASSYSYEKNRIVTILRETEDNRFYTRSKDQIEKEKFKERIEVYPKDWCRIS